MKLSTLLIMLFISTNLFSQSIREHSFESYGLKHQKLTENRILKIWYPFFIEDLDNGNYFFKAYFSQTKFISASVKYINSFDFAGQIVYSYSGTGYVDGILRNVEIETTVKFSDLTKGKGYDKSNGDDFSDFEVHYFYWGLNTKESLMKENIYFYPIQN